MRTALALALIAALVATPAFAQEANQVNTVETPANVGAEQNTALNDVTLPVADVPVTVAPAPAEPVSDPEPAPAREDDDGFPWGLVGLVGLIGLLGRVRS